MRSVFFSKISFVFLCGSVAGLLIAYPRRDIILQMKATGFVTAGGRSSRMGQDKAWLDLGGSSLIERVIGALRPVVTSVSVIANDEKYARLGLPVLPDQNTGRGPVEAIRTALANSSTDPLIVAGCDLPFVTTDLFALLLNRLDGHQVAVPVGSEGLLEPLCAAYTKDALDIVTSLIDAGERKISRIYDRLNTRVVTFDEVRHLAGSDLFFFNVNSPEDYQWAKAMLI